MERSGRSDNFTFQSTQEAWQEHGEVGEVGELGGQGEHGEQGEHGVQGE